MASVPTGPGDGGVEAALPEHQAPLGGRVLFGCRFPSAAVAEPLEPIPAEDVTNGAPRLVIFTHWSESTRAWARRWCEAYEAIDGEASLVLSSNDEALVFERPAGDRLDALVAGFGWLDETLAIPILRSFCDALARRHALGRHHGELSLECAWFDGAKVRLLPPVQFDSETGPAARSAFRILRYASPEEARGLRRGTPGDVWSLGLVAFELLTGKPFWRSYLVEETSVVGFFHEVLVDPLPTASERARELGAPTLPGWFDGWFARCVARDPSARFGDARAAGDAIGTSADPSSAHRSDPAPVAPLLPPVPPILPPIEPTRLAGAAIPVQPRIPPPRPVSDVSVVAPRRGRAWAIVAAIVVVLALAAWRLFAS